MSVLEIKAADQCRYDMIALGEIMLRLDPGDGRVRTARQFDVWEGGGEYNVARGLRRCFGLKTSVVTAFADNEVGRLVEDFIMQGGVDVDYIQWRDYDGIGRRAQRAELHRARIWHSRRERPARSRQHGRQSDQAGRY